jgi:hypothetical protein
MPELNPTPSKRKTPPLAERPRAAGQTDPAVEDRLVAVIPKNKVEELRVSLPRFKGVELIDVRTFAQFGSGEEAKRPTRKGITLKIEHLPQLIDALTAALADARARGLLDDKDIAA